ncbi:MAG: hypothetical protein H7A01_05470 [Hahellaceae bacterium]|nr:hypothetical protein [Hahellaceae bacterium]MCP5212865.1 hypothetical protein [Hahellaceae bacterium]
MADIHIEDFCKDSAKVLIQLYNAFPRRTSVYVEDIAGDDNPDEYGLHSNRHMACFGAMLWLAEEGFIRYIDTIKQEALDQAVLSQRAMKLLSQVCTDPVVLDNDVALSAEDEASLPPQIALDKKTYISILREVIESGSSTRITRVMQRLFLS